MKKLNYGVIGCGVFGEYQIMGVVNLDNANLVAICDKDQNRMMEMAQKYNVAKTYTDYKELLKDEEIEAVIIVTPDQAHAEITIAALNAGKHVLCEKPMSLDLDECKQMINTSDKTGKKLMIGQICRMTPGFIEAKRLVDLGVIGDLYYVESEYAHDYSKIPGSDNWRTTPERHPIIGGACHAIDLLRWIAGDPTETFAYSNHKVLTSWPVDDCTISVFKFPNDVIGKVFCSIGCKRNYTMRTLLYGTKGTITVNNKDPYIYINRARLCDDGNVLGGTWGEEEHELTLAKPIDLDHHNTKGENAQFCDCILNDKPLPTDGREGAKTVAVCNAVVESCKTGMPVKIEYNF